MSSMQMPYPRCGSLTITWVIAPTSFPSWSTGLPDMPCTMPPVLASSSESVIFSTIARYAYGEGMGDATVRFDFDPAARVAAITFEDSGTPYDPLAKEDPDISLGAQERSAGGLGIFLVKKTMDGMRYRYENGKNILTLQKKI